MFDRNEFEGKKPKELTWDERLDRIKTNIETDKLLNRYKTPYDEKTLKEMEELGEEEYNRITDERNKMMRDILNGMDFKYKK